MATSGFLPSLRSASRAKSIIMIPFFLTIRIRRMIPMRATTLSSWPKSNKARMAPTPAEGSVDRIVRGWM